MSAITPRPEYGVATLGVVVFGLSTPCVLLFNIHRVEVMRFTCAIVRLSTDDSYRYGLSPSVICFLAIFLRFKQQGSNKMQPEKMSGRRSSRLSQSTDASESSEFQLWNPISQESNDSRLSAYYRGDVRSCKHMAGCKIRPIHRRGCSEVEHVESHHSCNVAG
jgi:hypothetical protein